MRTVASILAAASRLSPEGLRELKAGIARLERQQSAITIRVRTKELRLVRLSDGEFLDLARNSIAIKEDLGFLIRLHMEREIRGLQGIDFARLDAMLTHLTGPSGQRIDMWKGSFCFPFSVHFSVETKELTYLLEVYNNNDSIYYPFRKIVPPGDKRIEERTYHPPEEAELSRDEMNLFLLLFEEHLIAQANALQRELPSYVRGVRGPGIVYGLCGGEFFEEERESEEAWSAAIREHERRIEEEIDPKTGCRQR